MKNIEPGCRAILVGMVVDTHLNGTECMVQWPYDLPLAYHKDGSIVSAPKNPWLILSYEVGPMVVAEHKLMRIDGFDGEIETVEQEEELTA